MKILLLDAHVVHTAAKTCHLMSCQNVLQCVQHDCIFRIQPIMLLIAAHAVTMAVHVFPTNHY